MFSFQIICIVKKNEAKSRYVTFLLHNTLFANEHPSLFFQLFHYFISQLFTLNISGKFKIFFLHSVTVQIKSIMQELLLRIFLSLTTLLLNASAVYLCIYFLKKYFGDDYSCVVNTFKNIRVPKGLSFRVFKNNSHK